MQLFAIFDVDAVLLQWIGHADSSDAAIKACNGDIGLIEEANDDLLVAAVSGERADALRQWHEAGARAADFPTGIRAERVGAEHVAKLLGFARAE